MSHDESGQTCACGGNCSCQSSDQNVYLTREEYIERLEHYLVDLKAEIVSVESELAELKTPVAVAMR